MDDRRNYRFSTLFVVGLLFGATSAAQSPAGGSSLFGSHFAGSHFSVSADYMEVKDQINHGFVFRGPDLLLAFGVTKRIANGFLDYSVSLGGGGKTVIGTWGFRWALSPIDTAYRWRIHQSGTSSFFIGPEFALSYNVQNYPDMHAGTLNWLTTADLGIGLLGFTNFRDRLVRLEISITVLGAVSRPEARRDPYVFRLSAREVIQDMNSDWKLVLPNDYSSAEIEVGVFLTSRSFVDYRIQFSSYGNVPSFQQLSYGLHYVVLLRRGSA